VVISGSVTAKLTIAPNSAIQRTKHLLRSEPNISTTSPKKIGSQMRKTEPFLVFLALVPITWPITPVTSASGAPACRIMAKA
jgi:hypothetical protein